jgi:hypothetical protein
VYSPLRKVAFYVSVAQRPLVIRERRIGQPSEGEKVRETGKNSAYCQKALMIWQGRLMAKVTKDSQVEGPFSSHFLSPLQDGRSRETRKSKQGLGKTWYQWQHNIYLMEVVMKVERSFGGEKPAKGERPQL